MVIHTMRKMFLRWDIKTWISDFLLILLLCVYSVIIYVIVIMAGTLPLGILQGDFPSVLFQTPRWLDLIGFVLIGITLIPVSRWLNIRIHDLVYSQDDLPYVLASRVTKQLQNMTSPQFTLPVLVEMIAHTLHLPFVAIETTLASPLLRFSSGDPPAGVEVKQYAITYLDTPIGNLLVSARTANQALPASYITLLKDIAQQLGIALRAAQLTAELQASREGLVIAREEERRRIRNDLHDGLAPTLSSLQLQLGAVRNLVHRDPEQAEVLINALREDMRNATTEIRQLVYDLRPPMLDELGLVGAMRNTKFVGSEVRIDIHAPEPMPKLPAAVEVAVYRIASEALHNVVKHAQATTCLIQIEMDGGCLILKVIDNGKSLPPDAQAGIGIHSMKERAAELGGILTIQPGEPSGTCVFARIPLESGCTEV